jgi:hypothetical protein
VDQEPCKGQYIMTNHEINCDSYFKHIRPTFVKYPHLIIYPSKFLIDIITDITNTVPRLWPVLWELIFRLELNEEKPLGHQIDWESERCKEILRLYSGSCHFANQFCLFCDARVMDSDLEYFFPAEVLDDPWHRIISFVDKYNWIMVPDEHAVFYVIIFSHAMSHLLNSVIHRLSSVQQEWAQIKESDSGSIECTGFMAKYGNVCPGLSLGDSKP